MVALVATGAPVTEPFCEEGTGRAISESCLERQCWSKLKFKSTEQERFLFPHCSGLDKPRLLM